MCQEKIDELINDFDKYLEIFREKMQFSGPSIYFHDATIGMRRSADLHTLIKDEKFIEYLYAVLTSWGMHSLRGGPKLLEFDKFAEETKAMGQKVLSLDGKTLGEITKTEINLLYQTLVNNSIMQTNTRIVGNSKLLHHLLPDLIPPIDGANILRFFDLEGSDIKVFPELMNYFKSIYNKIAWNKISYDGPMNSSRPKLIDNAIIGYNIDIRG